MESSGRAWRESGRIKAYPEAVKEKPTGSFLSGLRQRPNEEAGRRRNGGGDGTGSGGGGHSVLALFGSKVGVPISYGKLGPQGSEAADSIATDIYWHFNPGPVVYSRKVFVGGLPLDVGDDELQATFARFGPVLVDWPYKRAQPLRQPLTAPNPLGPIGPQPAPPAPPPGPYPNKSTGYVFLIYESEAAVVKLVGACVREEGERLYIGVGSAGGGRPDKAVQVRPWRLADSDFLVNQPLPLSPRYTVFVGAVPRPMKAVELAHAINKLYGGVGYAGIDTDAEFAYPRGSGRVVFFSEEAYLAAIRARYISLGVGEAEKRVEMKPYVMDGQACSVCAAPAAPLFCPHPPCLAYFCDACFGPAHAAGPGLAAHQPAVRDPARLHRPPHRPGAPFPPNSSRLPNPNPRSFY